MASPFRVFDALHDNPDLLEDSAIVQSPIDGLTKAVAVRKSSEYPFHAVVALSEDDYLAAWQREVKLALAGAISIFAFASVQTRSIVRKAQADRQLADREADLSVAQAVASIGSWRYDEETGNLSCSAEFCRLFELSPDARISVDQLSALIHVEDRGKFADAWKQVRSGQPTDHTFRIIVDHAMRWVRMRTEMTRYGTSDDISIIGTFQDVTDGEIRAIQMNYLLSELTEANAELERFTVTASHDLREPLRTISAFTEMMRRQYGLFQEDGAKELAQLVIDAAARMNSQILGLTHLSQERHRDIEFKPVDLNEVCAQAMDNLEEAIAASKAEVVVTPLPVVRGDPARLCLLIENLIGNAVKFHEPGHQPHIRVSAETGDRDWTVSVSDDGIGIPETDQDVFEIFRRLHNGMSYQGTGLGLNIAKHVVRRHGGRIWHEAVPTGGTVFRFTIPKAVAVNQEPELQFS